MPPKKQTAEPVKNAPKRARTVSKSDPNRPSYGDMIKEAITDHKNRKGSSRAVIMKYITETYNIPKASFTQTNSQLKQALKRGVESGALKQVSGTGASGSFKLGDNAGSAGKAKPKRSPRKPMALMSCGPREVYYGEADSDVDDNEEQQEEDEEESTEKPTAANSTRGRKPAAAAASKAGESGSKKAKSGSPKKQIARMSTSNGPSKNRKVIATKVAVASRTSARTTKTK